jgi:hypothetical protein
MTGTHEDSEEEEADQEEYTFEATTQGRRLTAIEKALLCCSVLHSCEPGQRIPYESGVQPYYTELATKFKRAMSGTIVILPGVQKMKDALKQIKLEMSAMYPAADPKYFASQYICEPAGVN